MKKLIFLTTALVSLSISLPAQTNTVQQSFLEKNIESITFYLLLIGMLIIVLSILGLSYMLLNMAKTIYRQALIEKGLLQEEPEEEVSWESKLLHSLTLAVPVAREKEIDLGHEYDGIRELDNRLPPWWVGLFYVTLIWGFAYFVYYHVLDKGPLQEEEYAIEMALAEKEKEAYLSKAAEKVNETNVKALLSDADLSKGKQIYSTYCSACHGNAGEGGVGPNLTDKYWLHGGGIKNIFKVIKYGVPAKGMISWQTQLKPSEIQQVASYILTLQGTNPPNAKEPQGEEYIENPSTEASGSDTTAVKI